MHRTVQVLLLVAALVGVHADDLAPCGCNMEPDNCTATPTLDKVLQDLHNLSSPELETVYRLQPGEHCVRMYYLIVDLVDVSLEGPAVIKCSPGTGLAFADMTNLHLAHLSIDGCGLGHDHVHSFLSHVNISIDYFFTLSNSLDQYAAMVLGNVIDFSMENSSISNTRGLGLLGINILGESTLNGVTIEHNVPDGCFSVNSFNFSTEKLGGGALFSYHDPLPQYDYDPTDSIEFSIVDSRFEGNSYCGYGPTQTSYLQQDQLVNSNPELFIGAGGGLSIILTQFDYTVNVTVRDSTFRNNTALYGGAAYINFFTGVSGSIILFDNCVFQFNGVEDSFATDRSYSIVGSALLLIKDSAQPLYREPQVNSTSVSQLMISNSLFMNNTAFTGTVSFFSLYMYGFILRQENDSVMTNCTFKYNRAVTSPGIFMQEWKGTTLQLGMNIVLDYVTFSHNTLYDLADILSPSSTIGVIVTTAINLTISDCTFSDNQATAVAATTSTIYIMGDVTFFNNSASYGGGMALSSGSLVIMRSNTTLYFRNNTGAISGGAVYVTSLGTILGTFDDCFLLFVSLSSECTTSFSDNCPDITKLGSTIVFEGNTAPLGGMIYGSTLNTCPWVKKFRDLYAPEQANVGILDLLYNSTGNFTSPLSFDVPPQGIEAVSTPTTRIAVHLPDVPIGDTNINLNMAPGVALPLHVSNLDAFGQSIPAVISSKSLRDGTSSVIGENNYHLNSNTSSDITVLRIYSAPNVTNIDVSFLAIASYTQTHLMINVTACPDGYYWNHSSRTCECSPNLINKNIGCTDEGQLLVPSGSWVGIDDAGVLVFGFCPLDYCKSEVSIVNVVNSSIDPDASIYDVQCASNYSRGGVSCGSCIEGYSTILSSNRCHKCSNVSLLLLLLFAAYGIVLIFGMIYLDFTISEGFLNGLLFFSNILTLYAPYLLLPNIRPLFLPFYWLNLKVGFETCLFDGMTALSSYALNFVFPFYLYFLLLMIVLLSRWSSRFSKWLCSRRCSPVKVFATIIVMTYANLLETCFSILAFTKLNEDKAINKTGVSYRWTYDPSVRYFRSYHAALAVFAILLLLILIPAPFLWMFPNKFARLNKYQPFFDAVWAPLKSKFRFWVSLRLIFRIVPLVLISFVQVPLNLLLLCVFLLTLLYVHGVVQPFKGAAQNAVDSLFQVELIGMTLLALYFIRIDLTRNRILDDVDTALNINSALAETTSIQVGLIVFAVVCVYVSGIIVFVLQLPSRFPRLKHLSVRAWNYMTCRKFQVKERYQSITGATYPEITSSYGSGDKDDHVNSRTPVAIFSVLREPLLESGEADLDENSY